jgi:hypothetical protein
MESIFEQAKCAVCGEDIIHPDKTTVSNLLEILAAVPNLNYLALVHGPKSELFHKKFCKEKKKGAQHLTLLTKLQGKKTPSTKHVPCTDNVTDEDHVNSAMTLDDSDAMLLFMAWGSDEYLR